MHDKKCPSMLKYYENIYKRMTDEIFGQDAACKELARAASKQIGLSINPEQSTNIHPDRIFITAPSGAGKTLLIETLKRVLLDYGIATRIANTAMITPAGYSGLSLVDFMKNLSPFGIAVFDEVDKRLRPENNTGGYENSANIGDMFAGEILRYMDGIRFSTKDQKILDTGTVMFVFIGTFSDIRQAANAEARLKIGFSEHIENVDDTQDEVTQESIIDGYGLTPEFFGRINHFIHLKPFDKKAIEKVYARTCQWKQEELENLYSIKLTISEKTHKEITSEALSDNLFGARMIERKLSERIDNVLDSSEFDVLTEKMVTI